jgi:predicted CoA-binding protein
MEAEGSRPGTASFDGLRRILTEAETIAVVGASADPSKDAHAIPRYMQEQGYRVIPVNPRGGEILGVRAYPSLADVDVPIDMVNVFRPPAEAEDVALQAITVGAKVLWFQLETQTDEAVRLASEAGLEVVADLCLGVVHAQVGLGPGPGRSTTL